MRKQRKPMSTAERLFFKYYLVKVPNKAFIRAEEVDAVNIPPMGGIQNAAKVYINEERMVNACIADIATWFFEGHSVRLVDLSNATEMFNAIDAHLASWLDVAPMILPKDFPPVEEFEALDKLAAAMYPLVDIDVNSVTDLALLSIIGNAIDFNYMLKKQEATAKPPYVPYTPKIFPYTMHRWEGAV